METETNQTPAQPDNAAASPAKKQPHTLREIIESDEFKRQMGLALPKHLTPDRMARVAVTLLIKTPALAQCSPASFLLAMMTCSALGLEPDGRRAHLIPYGKDVQLIVDYKGIVELVLRSGQVSKIHADVVCENDHFDVDRGEIVAHKIDYRKPRGEPFAAYSIVRFKDGAEKCEVMTAEEIDAVRSRSRAGKSGPWVTDWREMAKKTVFRRMSKWLPLSAEIRDAVESDDDQFDYAKTKNVTPRGEMFPGLGEETK